MPERPAGLFDTRYRAFLETVAAVRAQLHRYCARMTGSRLDGEDLVQETLFEAYTKIETLDDARRLKPWLFRIAHNRCIDFLRRRHTRERAESTYSDDIGVVAAEPATTDAHRAIERLVGHLPPKERACVLLKDVFDYSLEETAELVDSTVGGVKSALSRGRSKLAGLPAEPAGEASRPLDPDTARLLRRYVDLFNHHDWDGVRSLTSADARLRVADCFDGLLRDSPYFAEYERNPEPWTMALGAVDGEPVLLVLFQRGDRCQVAWPVRVHVAGGVIDRIEDYYACPWMLENAAESDLKLINGPVVLRGA
ncbi:RNA polymerase sigma factor [Rhizobium leguminosarum]|uniref:RNA polymerase subunit sigma-70 n=2 Tax=Rhizobium TaxID=379 RepID=A0A179BFM6_RHILE|nr:RNA polymerase subunit sigma-70 [Rhizobium leguminosarum]